MGEKMEGAGEEGRARDEGHDADRKSTLVQHGLYLVGPSSKGTQDERPKTDDKPHPPGIHLHANALA